jgi:hypothetical protein
MSKKTAVDREHVDRFVNKVYDAYLRLSTLTYLYEVNSDLAKIGETRHPEPGLAEPAPGLVMMLRDITRSLRKAERTLSEAMGVAGGAS